MHQKNLRENLNHWNYINRYSDWMFRKYEPYLGKRIFEVGAGNGRNLTYYVGKCEKVVATDIFDDQIELMRRQWGGSPYFIAKKLDILNDDISEYKGQFDTVVCINTLEHLSNDYLAVDKMKQLLICGGNIIILVPAFQKLYGYMDKNLGHYRRYAPGDLVKLADYVDMDVVYNGYFNIMGIMPWYLKSKFGKDKGGSFSSDIDEDSGKWISIASAILEPIEKIIPPKAGISEIIVMKKR